MRRYQRLLSYAIRYWRGWLLIIVVTLLYTAFGLLQPWPMKILVDHVLGQKPLRGALGPIVGALPGVGTPQGLLAWVVLAGLGLYALNSLMDVVLTCAWIRVGQRTVYDLASDLFAHLQRRSLLFHSRHPVGDSISRITGDSWCVYTVVDTLLFKPKHALLTVGGMVALMAYMDAGLTLLALAVAPCMAGSSLLLGRPIRAVARAGREVDSRIQSHVQQTLSSIPVVQAFAQERREHRRFQELTRMALRVHQRGTLLGSLGGLGAGLLSTLGTGAILWVGAHRVLEGRLSLGTILVFLAYLGTLQAQLGTLAGLLPALQGAGASLDRVLEVLTAEPEVAERPDAPALPPVRGHLRFEAVGFGYEPGRPVLRDVWLEVLPGQSLAVVGPTGAGKSTLVSLVPRLFDPWSGRVLIDGHDVRDVRLRSLRDQVALVLQEPFLFPTTVAENIAYGRPGATRAEVEAAARAANAEEFIARLPGGYDAVLGPRGATLSGGERQRLAIARAILKDAPILILDEPTSALDAAAEELVLEAVGRLMRGRTTLVIAHRLSTVRRADRIVVVEGGRVVEAGTHQELLAARGLYHRLHHLQSKERSLAVGVGG